MGKKATHLFASKTVSKPRALTLFVAFLVGIAAFVGLGTVRGNTQTLPPAHPTYEVEDLGTLGGNGSAAFDINDSGQVVGSGFTSSGSQHAFLYSDGQMTDLNTLLPADSGLTISMASAINSDGQIAATGGGRALLLTPVYDFGASTAPWTIRT